MNIFITGLAGSGKSTVARFLAKSALYTVVSEGYALRRVVQILGLDPKDRANLQLVGEGMRALLGQEVWCKAMLASNWMDYPLVLDDLRHQEDADLLRSLGWVGIRVTSPSHLRETRLRARDGDGIDFSLCDAPSEHLMDSHPHITYCITNDSTVEVLKGHVDEIVRGLQEHETTYRTAEEGLAPQDSGGEGESGVG